uniref:Glutaredoxin domain-containing protein n=1 Tax=Macrostomum lignano TaxID=282301 RepID=A0A1I8F8E3_9PLAT
KQEARCSGSSGVASASNRHSPVGFCVAPAAVAAVVTATRRRPETSSAAGPSASPPEPLTDASSPQQVSDWLERNRARLLFYVGQETENDTVNAGRFRIVMKEYQTCCDE